VRASNVDVYVNNYDYRYILRCELYGDLRLERRDAWERTDWFDELCLYVTNLDSATLSAYSIGANGALTVQSPATYSPGSGAHGIAILP
jgi:hypothetical protein